MVQKKWNPALQPAFEALIEMIDQAPAFDAASLEAAVKEFMQEHGLKPGEVFSLLRLSLAGTMQGPAVFDMAALLGKTDTVQRLRNALTHFNQVSGAATH